MSLELSNLRPAAGSKHGDRFRRGRGHGSGNGKTAGKGHKGQKARSGATRPGFEGGQMPLHRRLPKRGFTSWTHEFVAEVRLSDLEKLGLEEINLGDLINANVIKSNSKDARVILSGEIKRKVILRGITATKGAKAAIEAAGGSVVVEADK